MIKRIAKAYHSTVRAMFGELEPTGHFWVVLGIVTLGAAAVMSFKFGSEVSGAHAAFLACISGITAYGPHTAQEMWDSGRKGIAIVAAVFCLGFLSIEFGSHAGYTAGLRGSNVEVATVQNSKYDGAQETAKENKALLESFKKQLAEFKAKNGEWVTTVSADALRAQLESANLAIKLEAAKKGCKDKCLARTKERDEIAAKIATIEAGNKLAEQVTAQQALVDKRRDVAATVEHKSSAVDHQNKFFLQQVAIWGNGSTEASQFQQVATMATAAMMMAIAGTFGPGLCFWFAGFFKRRNGLTKQASQAAATSATGAPESSSVVNLSRITVGDINREKLRLLLDRSQPTALAA